ncbi:hypothetical protein [Catellatospora citrea]|uniref:Uncharacterized protein n=1 Tax=Catellatospora citrea TaxID=53366 RepID=A0A8J3KBG8_9ACTN|nr:hypothetical protein [Catellatospora citrea]RKE11435.1 hypothetical protein C8E86_6362 [Catellatospora citrea]GIF99932.1 hypothetical protein Cci01nite_50260 [Catellatospora citrea]
MSTEIERRYERLLRLYPKAYLDHRGAEMLGTLLDAADDGRGRPPRREIAALMLGALRARVGAAAGLPVGEAWLSAVRVGALLLLAYGAALSATRAGRVVFSDLLGDGLRLATELGFVGATVALVPALYLAARGRYGWATAIAGVGFAFEQLAQIGPHLYWNIKWAAEEPPLTEGWAQISWHLLEDRLADYKFWPLTLAVLLMLPLLRRRLAVPGTPLWWLLAVPLSVLLLPTDFNATLRWQPFALTAVCLGALAWSFVDARVGLAVAVLPLPLFLQGLGHRYLPSLQGNDYSVSAIIAPAVVTAVLIAAGAVLVRRQARL